MKRLILKLLLSVIPAAASEDVKVHRLSRAQAERVEYAQGMIKHAETDIAAVKAEIQALYRHGELLEPDAFCSPIRRVDVELDVNNKAIVRLGVKEECAVQTTGIKKRFYDNTTDITKRVDDH